MKHAFVLNSEQAVTCTCLVCETVFPGPVHFPDRKNYSTLLCCPACAAIADQILRDYRRRRSLSSIGVPEKFHSSQWDDFDSSAAQRAEVLHAVQFWIANETPYRGLYIQGEVGRGKTMLASAAAAQLNQSDQDVMFAEIPELVYQLQLGWHRQDPRIDPRQPINDLLSHQWLILDDLGAEKQTPFVQQSLYQLFQTIDNSPKYRVLITSNLCIGELEVHTQSPRIVSRIAGLCHFVLLDGVDYRMKNVAPDR